MNLRDMDMCELLEAYQDKQGHYHFEGERGVERLGKLCKTIGYNDRMCYNSSDVIAAFLADNPGAIDAVVEWIGRQNIPDWKQLMIASLELSETEEDDE